MEVGENNKGVVAIETGISLFTTQRDSEALMLKDYPTNFQTLSLNIFRMATGTVKEI